MMKRIDTGRGNIWIFAKVPCRIEQCRSWRGGETSAGGLLRPINDIPRGRVAPQKIGNLQQLHKLMRLATQLKETRNLGCNFMRRRMRRRNRATNIIPTRLKVLRNRASLPERAGNGGRSQPQKP